MREIARSFQRGIAQGLCDALNVISRRHALDTVVLSGGVFQNELLLEDLKSLLTNGSLQVWTNHAVPPNDGGISLGQAALAAFGRFDGPARTDRRTERVRKTMHELSIAMSIVELAEEEAERRGVQVNAVHLKLGALSGVVKEALLSCYEMACENTPLQGSRLVVEEVPVVIFCPSCQAQRPAELGAVVLLF